MSEIMNHQSITANSSFLEEQAQKLEQTENSIIKALEHMKKARNYQDWHCQQKQELEQDMTAVQTQLKDIAYRAAALADVVRTGSVELNALDKKYQPQKADTEWGFFK